MDRTRRSKRVRRGASWKIAALFLAGSAALLAVCLWRERDQWCSYFTQEWYWTPPVLVVSSDDWGGASPPETVEDLDKLRNALESVTDAQGRPLVLTAYVNPAEPDFERISQGQYACYSYRYCYRDKAEVASRLRALHEEGLVDMEFHGREHCNIPLWLSLLADDHPGYRQACREGHIPFREGAGWDVKADPRLPSLVASFADASTYPRKPLPVEEQYQMIASGLALMKSELGVRPVIFTPPCYVYDVNTLRAMALADLWFLDSVKGRIWRAADHGNRAQPRQQWDDGVEIAGVRGIVRNVHFEPYGMTQMSPKRILDVTMTAVRRALVSGKPVVVSSHRWNYVGAVNPNRDRDLLLLRELAARIKGERADILFLSASDLARHLYGGGEGSARRVELRTGSLSGMGKVKHGLRCLWVGHRRIRGAACLTGFSLVWLCAVGVFRFYRAKGSGGARHPTTDPVLP